MVFMVVIIISIAIQIRDVVNDIIFSNLRLRFAGQFPVINMPRTLMKIVHGTIYIRSLVSSIGSFF